MAVLNEYPVADTTTTDLWVRMLQHSSAKTLLVGVSQDNSADDVWRACNDPKAFVDMVHFACTDAVFPTLADMLGSATNENVIELPTTGTILNEELGQVSGLLSLLYAPSYHGRNWDRALRDVQLEFLQGGALTADLLVREREEGAASCVVRRRRLNDALARELSAAVAGGGSSGSGKSSHRVIVVHHERMTGASTAVRHVLLEKAMARSVTALEVTKLPTDSNDVRKLEAFLQLIHERSCTAAVVCLVGSDNITHDAVHRLMQSTGIGDIPNVVFVVTTRQRLDPRHQQGVVRHLELADCLTPAEVKQFNALFDRFSACGKDDNGGQDTVFLWGCALMANKTDAVVAFVAEHAAALSENDARALQAVAVTSGLTHSPLPLFAAGRLLFSHDTGVDAGWPHLRAKHQNFCSLVRFHNGLLHAPSGSEAFCATLFRAATLRLSGGRMSVNDIGQRTDKGTGLRATWDSDALFETAQELVRILCPKYADPPVHNILVALFAPKSSAVLARFDRDRGQHLFKQARRVSPRKNQMYLLAEQGRHLATYADENLDLIGDGLQLAEEGVELARKQCATQRTLSTLLGIKAHIFLARVRAQIRAGEPSSKTLKTLEEALADTADGFERDDECDNTHLAHALSFIAVEVARGAERHNPPAHAAGHAAVHAAVHWATRLQLCIDDERAEAPAMSEEKLRALWAAVEPLRPTPTHGELRLAVTAAEAGRDVADTQLSWATQFRQSHWPDTRPADATLIWRCLTQLLQRRSTLASFYHVREWVQAAVACDDTQTTLHDIVGAAWYLWMLEEVDAGQLKPSTRGPSKSLWWQWLVATNVLCGVSFATDRETPCSTPLWYLRIRNQRGAMLSDIRMTRPESPCAGTLNKDCSVCVRVCGQDICVRPSDNELAALPAATRLKPAGTHVRFFLAIHRGCLLVDSVDVC